MNFKVAFASAALMLAASTSAFAASPASYSFGSTGFADIGVVPVSPANPYVGVVTHTVGSFTDTFDFSVASSTLSSSANNALLTLSGLNLLDVTGLTYTLTDLTTSSTVGGTYTGDNTTYTTKLNVADAYSLTLSGTADGLVGGSYSFALKTIAAAVPEPETYGMMLGGLGLLGFMARRKAKKAA